MHHQEYLNKPNNFFQENQSAMRTEVNGRKYCKGNSRNIRIRYFFIKYRMDKWELSIMHCLAHRMLEDYFAKPLQGALFYNFRRIIMGIFGPYTLLKTSFNIQARRVLRIKFWENRFYWKYSIKNHIPPGELKILEDEKNNLTYSVIFSAKDSHRPTK